MSLVPHQTRFNYFCALSFFSSLSCYSPHFALSLSRSFLTPIRPAMDAFFTSVFGGELSRTSTQRSPTPDHPVLLFADVSGEAVIAGTATLSNASIPGKNSLRRKLHKHSVLSREKLRHVAMCSPPIYQKFKTLPRPYCFFAADRVRKTLGKLLTSGFRHGTHAQCVL